MGSPRVGRRTALVAAGTVVLGACGATPAPLAGGRSASALRTLDEPSETSESSSTIIAWQPGPGELEPAAKLAAVRAVEQRDAVQIIDAQYGGLLAMSASVLVVTAPLHTYDVRLSRGRRGWRVTAVYPSRTGRAATRHSLAASHVLASDRIALPPAARRDVLSGHVHDTVLEGMLAVSRRWHIDVSVIRSGHPLDVFGTTRPSDHPLGRAFDTWAIDGQPVVAPATPKTLVVSYMEAVTAAGSYNTGGPYLLGSAPQWFSDRTHHDHVHAGFAT